MALSDTSRMFFSCYYFFLFFCHFLFNTKFTQKFILVCPLDQLLFIQKSKEKWIKLLNILFLIRLEEK